MCKSWFVTAIHLLGICVVLIWRYKKICRLADASARKEILDAIEVHSANERELRWCGRFPRYLA